MPRLSKLSSGCVTVRMNGRVYTTVMEDDDNKEVEKAKTIVYPITLDDVLEAQMQKNGNKSMYEIRSSWECGKPLPEQSDDLGNLIFKLIK